MTDDILKDLIGSIRKAAKKKLGRKKSWRLGGGGLKITTDATPARRDEETFDDFAAQIYSAFFFAGAAYPQHLATWNLFYERGAPPPADIRAIDV